VAAFWVGIPIEVTQEDGVVPRYHRDSLLVAYRHISLKPVEIGYMNLCTKLKFGWFILMVGVEPICPISSDPIANTCWKVLFFQ